MVAASSRTLLHYTSKKIASFHNFPKDQVKLLARYGKPMGFWYAYGTNWRNLVEMGRAGRSANTVTLRYEVTLPENVFVTELESATQDTIFELSASNLNEFMERFHKDKYQSKSEDLIEAAFIALIKEHNSDILDEYAEKDETGEFHKFLGEIQKELENEDDEPDVAMYMELAYDGFYDLLISSRPSPEALYKDNINDYNWELFWKDVASSIGGVEFHTDLFTIYEWNGLWLPWTNKLGVHSGVIFHPNKFLDGVLVEQILHIDPITTRNGGRRRTRRDRKQRQRRNKTRNKV